MNLEDLDRLSILLEDAYRALNEAWEIPVRAGEHDIAHLLLMATINVKKVAENLMETLPTVAGEDVVTRIEDYSRRVS